MNTSYFVVIAHAWMNQTGHGIEYSVPTGVGWSDPKTAISEGFEICGHDDFNIAKVVNKRVVELRWMENALDESPIVLAELTSLVRTACD